MSNDMPEFTDREIRKARKKHRCCECNVIIKPGDKYVRTCGVWDYGFNYFKQCLGCDSIFTTCYEKAYSYCGCDWDEGPCFGELFDWINEMEVKDDFFDIGSIVYKRQSHEYH